MQHWTPVDISPAALENLCALKAQGYGWRRLSQRTGFSIHTIRRRVLAATGHKGQRPYNAPIEWNSELDAALLNGRRGQQTWADLEHSTGISVRALRARLVALDGDHSPLLKYVRKGPKPRVRK